MENLVVQIDKAQPLSRQVYESVRLRIVAGELRAGERLPPTRALARELAVSRNVVIRAYDQLLSEGYVQARVGRGTWVSYVLPDAHLQVTRDPTTSGNGRKAAPRLSQIARHALTIESFDGDRQAAETRSDVVSFSLESALIDGRAVQDWNRVVRKHLQRASDSAGAGDDSPELRRAVARHLHRSRGISAHPDEILVLTGARQSVDLVSRALLQPDSYVLIENPGRRSARLTFEMLGARLTPCHVDREGMDVDRARAGRAELPRDVPPRAQLAYVTPSHQFPTGEVMTLARRRKLLAWASEADALVIEDDTGGELRFDGSPLPALRSLDTEGRVIYVGSLSRTLPPDLRLGYLILPPSLVRPAAALKRLLDWTPPATTQAALADFCSGGHYDQHLRRVQQQMGKQRSVLLNCLEDRFGDAIDITGTTAGLHVMVWFRKPKPEAEETLLEAARELGVGVAPYSPFCLTAPSRLGVVLGYAGLDEADIRLGIHRLAMAWRATCRTVAEAVPVA